MKISMKMAELVASAFRRDKPGIAAKALRRIVGRIWSDGFNSAFHAHNRGEHMPWPGKQACLTLSFDCDHEADYRAMPDLLDALAGEGLAASFACIAKWVELDPDSHLELIRRGHELVNHTHTHPSNSRFHPDERFNEISPEDRRAEIVNADRIFRGRLNYRPSGFRTPHFGDSHTRDVYPILAGLGYQYSSSRISIQCPGHGMPYRESCGIWEFPLSFDPAYPNTCFDAYNRLPRTNGPVPHDRETAFFDRIERVIRTALDTGSYVNLYFDPADIGRLGRFRDFIRFLGSLKDRLWVAPYDRILREWSPNSG
ncbi:MAG: polysaccharide deacetylase family protein [bacterium]|nr:polysaccharide deacetylase family protein [bacterium]